MSNLVVESSISGVLDPALSVTIDTSLSKIVTTAQLKSDRRIVQKPRDFTRDEITIRLNGVRLFTGFVDGNNITSDGQRGIVCSVSLRSICAPTAESMICSERAVSSEDDVAFRNSPLSSIVDNTMRWEDIDHPFVFRGETGNKIVRAFQWAYGEVFGDTILRLASERGVVFTDLPEGGFQFIGFKDFEGEILHNIRESDCVSLSVNTDYDQRYRQYTGISRQDPISDVRVTNEVVSYRKVQLSSGAIASIRDVTPRRVENFDRPVDDLQVQRVTTTPSKKNWCKDYTSRELNSDELRQAVDYEINRRRASGTTITAVIPSLVPFRKGERVDFHFESEDFEGTPSSGWTIRDVKLQQTGQESAGNTTTITCVPTQQFSIPEIDGSYNELIGDE